MDAQFLRIRGRERVYPVSRFDPEREEVIVETEIGDLSFPIPSVEFISMEEMKTPVEAPSDETAFPEVDLHGLHVEDAMEEVDRLIDNAQVAGHRQVRIIHGKGTGVLRQAVWEHLRADRRVGRFALDHTCYDGTGATLVEVV